MKQSFFNRKVIVVIIAIGVGLFHFITGPQYSGPFPIFVNSYMLDILLPFAVYLVLGIAKQNILKSAISKSLFVFEIGIVFETLQYFNIPLFGSTFDWMDIIMYAIGIGLAVLFEKHVLANISAK